MHASPRDIHEVDVLALHEAISAAASAGLGCAHGVASFRLSELLDQSKQLVAAYNKASDHRSGTNARNSDNTSSITGGPGGETSVAPILKMRAEICQRKRREIPKGGVEDWHLSDEERLVRWPGAYLDAGSSLGLRYGRG